MSGAAARAPDLALIEVVDILVSFAMSRIGMVVMVLVVAFRCSIAERLFRNFPKLCID